MSICKPILLFMFTSIFAFPETVFSCERLQDGVYKYSKYYGGEIEARMGPRGRLILGVGSRERILTCGADDRYYYRDKHGVEEVKVLTPLSFYYVFDGNGPHGMSDTLQFQSKLEMKKRLKIVNEDDFESAFLYWDASVKRALKKHSRFGDSNPPLTCLRKTYGERNMCNYIKVINSCLIEIEDLVDSPKAKFNDIESRNVLNELKQEFRVVKNRIPKIMFCK